MITVGDLLKSPALGELKTVAGHSGLNRTVRAVSVMDAPDSYKWLKGGEVILTTGYLFGDDAWLLEHFVSNLTEAGAAGIGIKKGRFISQIPEPVIKLAERHKFPVFEIPYLSGWSEIIYAYYELSMQSGADGNSNAAALKKPVIPSCAETDGERVYRELITEITNGAVSDTVTDRVCKLRGAGGRIYTAVISIEADNAIEVYRLMRKALKSYRIETKGRVSSHMADDTGTRTVILLEYFPKTDEPPEKWQFMFSEEADYCLQDIQNARIGMGGFYADLADTVKSYGQSLDALVIGGIMWPGRRFFLYAMVSAYGALAGGNAERADFSYIRALESNQTDFSFDGIETVEAYVEYSGYKKAAAKLFIHENTMRYRIQKIGDYLHLDMDDAMTCHMLITQIKLRKLQDAAYGGRGGGVPAASPPVY